MVYCCMPIKCDASRLLGAAPSLLAKGARYLAGFGKSSTDILIDEANKLAAIMRDKGEAVSNQGSIQGRNLTEQVKQWENQVEDLLQDVNNFKDSLCYRIPCLKDCPCWATDLLGRVRKLKDEEKELKELLGEKPLPRSHEGGNPQIVGREEIVSAVLGLLRNGDVKIIGIYGMPGIGKTAVLQKIYHELICSSQQGEGGLSRVILPPTVSRKPDILNLQKHIAQYLGLVLAEDGQSDSSGREIQQAEILFRKLSNRADILLLDDVWECLNWKKIGIVSSDIGEEAACKIIFTTSSRKLCEDLGARACIIKVGFLKDEESWKLFCQEAKKAEDDHSIAPLKQVINKCGGLPRAIITVSKHMTSRASSEEMVEKLKHSAHEISGMKREVLSPLKCIFDELEENSTDKMGRRAIELRQCLLYCSLFPEDETIYMDQLIDYWVGEEFLDAECGLKLDKARERGHDIINILMDELREGEFSWWRVIFFRFGKSKRCISLRFIEREL